MVYFSPHALFSQDRSHFKIFYKIYMHAQLLGLQVHCQIAYKNFSRSSRNANHGIYFHIEDQDLKWRFTWYIQKLAKLLHVNIISYEIIITHPIILGCISLTFTGSHTLYNTLISLELVLYESDSRHKIVSKSCLPPPIAL